jgi:glycosyltransferase involved in cell wall biosynthesis
LVGGPHNELIVQKFQGCADEVVFLEDDFSNLLFNNKVQQTILSPLVLKVYRECLQARSWEDVSSLMVLDPLRRALENGFDIITASFTKTSASELVQNVVRLNGGGTKFVLHLANVVGPAEEPFYYVPDGVIFPSRFLADHESVREWFSGGGGGGRWSCHAALVGCVGRDQRVEEMHTAVIAPIALPPGGGGVGGGEGEGGGEIRVGFVGRLSPERMPAGFVNAARIVLESEPDVRFYMLGGGALSAGVQDMVQDLGMGERLKLLGERPHDEMDSVLRDMNFDVVVNPCYETFGRGTVESMRAGAIVVGCAGGATPEIVQDGVTGFVVDCSDYRNLGEKVLEVLKKRGGVELAEMRARAADEVNLM